MRLIRVPHVWDLFLFWPASQFFVFLPYYAFFSPLGHARYDIIVACGQLPQHRHRFASKASTRYLLYVACTPCVACTVRLCWCVVYCTRKHLQVKPFFVVRFLFTCRSPLMVLVSIYIATDFVVAYFVPYIGGTFPKVARQIVRDISHVLLVE